MFVGVPMDNIFIASLPHTKKIDIYKIRNGPLFNLKVP
jgi:hypothetical protein